ncbi:MAG: aspartate carbamoyltransferase regulatory subunit [Gemmiger sp.]|uniref:aspartate carbamoyltransferase regulatory subunit n=1 Tax=Gemmiger sp. TaxID=2049027 RepID=UPI002E777AF1|nr:aspartate carbamoyltransferase regulatory subunit [Gemmiger sp.]MEE0800177.1 aspartate carbamoyltransferase regulatory subunit [Gemmiger sp.]
MLNVDEILNGVVIDHITAGTGLGLYHLLELEKLSTCSVALLQNVRSQKSGKKDIIKIEGDISRLDFDVLGYLDPQITLTFIEDGHVVKKVRPDQPKRLVNVIKCTNPRCITAIEEGCDHIFALTPSGRYRCVYCEQEFRVRP